MKNFFRLFGIIAIVATIGFGFVACDNGTTADTYTVTVNGGSGSGSYEAGANVTITATVPSGQQFANWTVNSGGATLANANSASTSFTMPANAVTVTANFSGTLSINGAWQNKTTGGSIGMVITIIDSDGYFTHVEGGWETVQNNGNIKIGDSFFRNITKTGDRTWSCQLQGYNTSTFALGSWHNCTLTLSTDGNTLTGYAPDTATPTGTFTRVQNDLNGAWQNKTTGGSIGMVITIIDSDGYFTHVEGGWETVLNNGNITIGDKFVRNITKTGDRTWSCQLQGYNTSTFALGSWHNCTLTLSTDGNTFTGYAPDTATPTGTFTRVR